MASESSDARSHDKNRYIQRSIEHYSIDHLRHTTSILKGVTSGWHNFQVGVFCLARVPYNGPSLAVGKRFAPSSARDDIHFPSSICNASINDF